MARGKEGTNRVTCMIGFRSSSRLSEKVCTMKIECMAISDLQ
jgi:hypothetical protein